MPSIEEYYKKDYAGKDEKAIEESLRHDSKEVVYGAQSVNVRMPKYLERWTEDWDIYSHSPEETAKEMERLLDKTFGGDFFEVRPAKHEGTFKVVSKVTKRGIADITVPDKTIEYQTIDGINYATLDEQVANIKRALADETSRFRWDKDKETLQRIEILQRKHPELSRNAVKRMKAEEREALGEDSDERLEREVLGKLAPKRRKLAPKRRKETKPAISEVRP